MPRRHERIGIVLQSGNLIPFLTAVENVELAMLFADGGSPGRSRLGVITAGRCGADALLDDSESGRRAAVFNLWLDHDPQRCVLQVRELREYVGVRVIR